MIEVFLVSNHNIVEAIEELMKEDEFGFDTETYGKNFSDRLFSLAICSQAKAYYFNFYRGTDHLGDSCEYDYQLEYQTLLDLQPVFERGVWYAHNAKFDLLKLRKEGINHGGLVRCTAISERILHNDKIDYSLDATAKSYGFEKDMSVMDYMEKHDLFETKFFMGKKVERIPQFYKVPFEMLATYAPQDAFLHLTIGKIQREKLRTNYQ